MASDDEQHGNSKSSNVTVRDNAKRMSLSMTGAMDNETVSRSPVGKKQTYDDEINESLRILKERKTGTSLAPVPDESRSQSAIDQELSAKISASNHSSVPSVSHTKLIRKRRSEIVPHLITPVKSIRSDTNVSRAYPDEPNSQNATDQEHKSTSNHSIKQSTFQNVVIIKSGKSVKDSHLLSPIESMRSNTTLARSPTNMDVIQHKAKRPKQPHSNDEAVHKHRSRSPQTPESSDDTDGHARRSRTRMSTRSGREQTPIADRSRRSRTPVDYTRFFASTKSQEHLSN